MSGTKAWKCFDANLRGHNQFQFEIGRTYELAGTPKLCVNGFHFHERGRDLFKYYKNLPGTRVCEIEVLGLTADDIDKSCTNRLRVVRELDFEEISKVISNVDGVGYGDGYGSGYGSGYGNGYGDGYGSGYGDGYGVGYGYGYGDGDGSGYGSGSGYGYGDGIGSGYGSGSGYGYGDGIGYGSGSGYYLKLDQQGRIIK